jgi:uracil-DNA glycosylase family 4
MDCNNKMRTYVPCHGHEYPTYYFCGEAPGGSEVESDNINERIPFIGRAGQLLRGVIKRLGSPKVRFGNVVPCRPISETGGNGTPSEEDIAKYSVEVKEDIRTHKPKTLILLGRSATLGFFPELKDQSLAQMMRTQYSWEGIPTYVRYHPSYILRNGGETSAYYADWVASLEGAFDPSTEIDDARVTVYELEDAGDIELPTDQVIAIDVETNGEHVYSEALELLGMSFAWEDSRGLRAVYVNTYDYDRMKQREDIEPLTNLIKLLKRITAYNFKYEYGVVENKCNIDLISQCKVIWDSYHVVKIIGKSIDLKSYAASFGYKDWSKDVYSIVSSITTVQKLSRTAKWSRELYKSECNVHEFLHQVEAYAKSTKKVSKKTEQLLESLNILVKFITCLPPDLDKKKVYYEYVPLSMLATYCSFDSIVLLPIMKKQITMMDDLEKQSLKYYQSHLKLSCNLDKYGTIWDDLKASELEGVYKDQQLLAIKGLLLNEHMRKELKLLEEDILYIASSEDAEDLKSKYYNPNTATGSNLKNLNIARSCLHCEELSMAHALTTLNLNDSPEIFKSKTEQVIYKEIDNNSSTKDEYESTMSRLFTENERSKLRKYMRSFKIEKLDTEQVEAIYKLFVITGVDFDKIQTSHSYWLYWFRLYKKVGKALTTYINGSVGRKSVWRYDHLNSAGVPIRKHLIENYVPGDKYVLDIGFNAIGAETRRWISPLHTIPWGSELREIHNSRYGDEGILVHVDFSQHELRVLSAMAGEESMIEIFKKNGDIHKMVASECWQKPESEITQAERRFSKLLSFSIVYGASEKSIADNYLGGDLLRARELLSNYYKAFPKLTNFIEESHRMVDQGYVRGIFGDKIFLNTDPFVRSKTLKQSVNYRVQNSASGIAGWSLEKSLYTLLDKGIPIAIFGFTHDSGDFDTVIYHLFELITSINNSMVKDVYETFGAPVGIDFEVGVTGGSLATLEEWDFSDTKVPTMTLSADVEHLRSLFKKLEYLGKLSVETLNEEEYTVPMSELFLARRAYSTRIGRSFVRKKLKVAIELNNS